MDRFSTRLAASLIEDRHRGGATARRAAATQATGIQAGPRPDATYARRILQQMGRPFGLRPAR